jgi:hypothetical protein
MPWQLVHSTNHHLASDPSVNYRLDGAFDEMFSAEARPRRCGERSNSPTYRFYIKA